jgi:hypothetical protein
MGFFQQNHDDVETQPECSPVERNIGRSEYQSLTEHRQQDADVHRVARDPVQPLPDQPGRFLADEKSQMTGEENRRRTAREQECEKTQAIDDRSEAKE